MEDSYIVNRVWIEMYRIKSWLIQIELYTHRKRQNTKIVTILIIVTSLLSFLCAIIQPFMHSNLQEYTFICNWVIGISSITAALSTVVRDFMPQITQPESEICELDKLHDFYTDYFHQLEIAFMQRYSSDPDMNDKRLTQSFTKIAKTEGDNQSRMNRLIRGLTKSEKRITAERTANYFQVTYNNRKYE